MRWFYNLKISVKLILSFIIVSMIAGAVGVFGIVKIIDINNDSTILYEQNTKPLGNLAYIGTLYQRARVNVRGVILDPTNSNTYIEKIDEYYKQIDENFKEYEKGFSTEEEKQKTNNLKLQFEKIRPLEEKVINTSLSGKNEEAIRILNQEVASIGTEITTDIAELIDFNVDLAAKTSADGDAEANDARLVMIFLVLICTVLSIVFGVFISRVISKAIKEIEAAANKLAVGDLNLELTIDTKDEIGQLAKSFKSLIASTREQAFAAGRMAEGDMTVDIKIRSENDFLGQKLTELVEGNNEILSGIVSAAEQVAAGSKQISGSSVSLSQGATEQASSVEELTASLEEISSQTKQNANNANQANELAEKAKLNAVQGNSQMKGMLKAMEDINESSSNISKIIKVIDDIAFQTNMLALNAAVEAARAGQHGKGFAVVAEEVKNLAARSANAAKETTEMIESSIKKSEEGTKIAKETAEALNKVVNEIEKVANIVNDINIASNEQAIGIEQINQGIIQVSQVIQTNSATSEESAAASEELSSQAAIMQGMVARFKLKHNTKKYGKYEGLSTEVLKMLDDMSEKQKMGKDELKDYTEGKIAKTKISLSDSEFGKY